MVLLEWVLVGLGTWTLVSVATGLLLGPVLGRASAAQSSIDLATAA